MISVHSIRNLENKPIALTIVVDEESIAEFQKMVQRACGLWPDASPEMKTFADEVTHGEIMQDYQRLYGKQGAGQ